MIPTKPIRPLTETAAAVPAVAAATTSSRTRPTSTPRLDASSSPRLSTSSTRRWRTRTAALTPMYGVATQTSCHDEVEKPPSSQLYTSRSVSERFDWTNSCTAVMNAATVTPARTSAPVARAAPTDRPSAYAQMTATVAPANAATGTSAPVEPTRPYAMAIVAPSP